MSTLTIEQKFQLRQLDLSIDQMSDEQKKEMILHLAKLTLEQQNAFRMYAGSHMFGY